VATDRGATVSFVEIKILLIAIYSHEHLAEKYGEWGGRGFSVGVALILIFHYLILLHNEFSTSYAS